MSDVRLVLMLVLLFPERMGMRGLMGHDVLCIGGGTRIVQRSVPVKHLSYPMLDPYLISKPWPFNPFRV